jgi:predicted S18 family serine protease
MVYIIKDYGKKKIQEKAIGELLERACSSSSKPKYDEVMEKARAHAKKVEEVLRSMGIEMINKIEIKKPSDLDKVARPLEGQGLDVIDKGQLKEAFIDVKVNKKNYYDVQVGGIKKR